MNGQTARTAMVVGGRVVTALIWGEVLGSAISKPIKAWRTKHNINVENVSSLLDTQNQRICDLEEKVYGKSK